VTVNLILVKGFLQWTLVSKLRLAPFYLRSELGGSSEITV